MSEGLPKRTERPPNKTERDPSMEGPPTVESMPIKHIGVLIKTIFPRQSSDAKIFMLIMTPFSEDGVDNYHKLLETMPEEHRKGAENYFASVHSPLVFDNPEQAKEWLDSIRPFYKPTQWRAIADFLEVEDTEH